MQETQAEAAITEVGELLFQDHLSISNKEWNKAEGDLMGTLKDGKTLLTNKVGQFGQSSVLKNKTSSKDFSLGFILPGECPGQEVKKYVQNIFDEEYRKACLSSHLFQQCFNITKIVAVDKQKQSGQCIWNN